MRYGVRCPSIYLGLRFIDNRLKPGFRDLRHMAFDLQYFSGHIPKLFYAGSAVL